MGEDGEKRLMRSGVRLEGDGERRVECLKGGKTETAGGCSEALEEVRGST